MNRDEPTIPALLGLARSVALACLFSSTAVGAPPSLGSYSCTAERAVGLQGDGANGQRYGGRIELPAAETHFGLSLGRTEVGQGRRCRPRQPGNRDDPANDEYSLWWFCRATTELTFSGGKYEPSLRGDDTNIFRDRLSGWFHLADDLRYVFAYTDFSGNFFLEEGNCGRD